MLRGLTHSPTLGCTSSTEVTIPPYSASLPRGTGTVRRLAGLLAREVTHQRRVERTHHVAHCVARLAPTGDGRAKELGIGGNERLFVGRHVILLVDCLYRTNRDAEAAIDALVRLDVHHSPAFIDALNGADLLAGAILDVDAGRSD